MSLRYALLALLRVGPLSGYELQKQFSLSVGHVWHAPSSQIYPELRKMEDEGLVVAEQQQRGEKGLRKNYHVTDEGERSYQEWVRSPLDYLRVRDPAHLRAAYLEAATADDARSFFRNHLEQWTSELTQWVNEIELIESLQNPMLRRRLEVMPEGEREATVAFKRFAYEGLVERAKIEIEWAHRGLELVDRLGGVGDRRA